VVWVETALLEQIAADAQDGLGLVVDERLAADVLTTTDSNVWGGDSGHTYTLTRAPDGMTDVDVLVVREGKSRKGRALAVVVVVGIIGGSDSDTWIEWLPATPTVEPASADVSGRAPRRYSCGSVFGSPNRGNPLLSANHVIAEIALSSRVSTSSAKGRARRVPGTGR
jgi:hypothetical protein